MSDRGATFTREVNGNNAIRMGDDLDDLYDVEEGDFVEFEVKRIHRKRGDE